jgi:hypothetical protein
VVAKRPAILDRIEARIADELAGLHPVHITRFEAMRVSPRSVPVQSTTTEYVYIIAEYQGRVLYYSDLENGWGIDTPDEAGNIHDHAGDLFQLAQVMNRLFGAPNIRTCGRGGRQRS